MRPARCLIVVAGLCLGLADCSSDPVAGVSRFGSGTSSFQHTLQKLPSGRNKLTVHVALGPGQSADLVSQQARSFADDFAKSTCPTGYDFFADAPLEGKGSAGRDGKTFIFQCR